MGSQVIVEGGTKSGLGSCRTGQWVLSEEQESESLLVEGTTLVCVESQEAGCSLLGAVIVYLVIVLVTFLSGETKYKTPKIKGREVYLVCSL